MILFQNAGEPASEASPPWLERPENVGLKAYLTSVVRLKQGLGESATLAQEADQFSRSSSLSIRTTPKLGQGEKHFLDQIGQSLNRIEQEAESMPAIDRSALKSITAIQNEAQTARQSLNVLQRLQKLQALDERQSIQPHL